MLMHVNIIRIFKSNRMSSALEPLTRDNCPSSLHAAFTLSSYCLHLLFTLSSPSLRTVFTPSSLSVQVTVAEMTAGGVSVVTVNATDRDSGVNARLHYSMLWVSGFYIDRDTGEATTHTRASHWSTCGPISL